MRKFGLFVLAAALLVVFFVAYNRDRPEEKVAPISRDEAAGITATTAVSTTYVDANVPATWTGVTAVVTSEEPVYNEPQHEIWPIPTDTPLPVPQRSWTLPAGTRVTVKCKAGLPYYTSDGRSSKPYVFVYYESGKPSIQGQGYVSSTSVRLDGRTPDTNEQITMAQVKLC